jgi:hypothetical protein
MKNADDNNCAPNSERSKIAFTGALSVMMNVVAKPKMKKMAPKTDMPTSKLLFFCSIMKFILGLCCKLYDAFKFRLSKFKN